MGLFDKLRKKFAKKCRSSYLYTEQEISEYEAFVEKNFGKRDIVLPGCVSQDIHLDIIIIPPTEGHPFYKLITMGMGAFQMNVPTELAESELEHAELVLYLPADWQLNSWDDQYYWPVRLMKVMGRIPIDNNSWLGFGHTVHEDAERLYFGENTRFNTMLLLNARNLDNEQLDLRLSGGKKINFYQMFPLYQEELDIKKETSLENLLSLFDEDDISPVFNIHRKNYGIQNQHDSNENGLSEKAARRDRSNTYIREQGIACLESLPFTTSADEVMLKDMDVRCKRAIAGLISIQLACDINAGNDYDESKKFFEKLLAQYEVEDALLEKERKLFDGSYTGQDALDVAWTYEAYWSVVWSLGLVKDMKAADDICDCEEAINLVSACESYEAFKNQCNTRTVDEVLDLLDLYYRYHWACVEKRVNPETEIGDLDPEVVYERRRGLEWLVSEEADWNEISLDT